MKYMVIDATGLLPAFYDEGFHGPALLPVYGPVPEATEDDPHPVAPQTGTEPNPAYPTGGVEISDDMWRDFLEHQGQRRWNAQTSTFDAYAPPPPPPPPREQVGAVFLRAIVDLGWWDLFEAGAAHQAAPLAQGGAGKPYDKRAWDSIGKTDRVMVLDAPLNRVARAAEAARVAASGAPAPAQPVVTVAAAMDHGDAMARAGS